MGRRLLAVATSTVLAVAALTGCSGDSAATDTFYGTPLDPPFGVSATPLVDTDGEPFSLTEDTDKRLTLVFYGYLNCPDICGIVMNSIAGAMLRLDDADRDQVDVVYVTTDPARDTEAALGRYLGALDPDFVGLTGDLDTIVDVAQVQKVAIEQGEKLPSGGYDVTHSTQVFGVDSDDETSVFWPQDTTAGEFAADIHTLLGKA